MKTRAADEVTALMQVGLIGAPFGVRGWVKLRSHTDPPQRILEHRLLHIGRGVARTQYRIETSGRSGGALTVKLSGIEDRDQATLLRGAPVCVARAELPPSASNDFYRADLIGCEVQNLRGVVLGTVRHFMETPAQVLMVVLGEREHWIPAVPALLRRVDLPARRIAVDWEAAED